MTKPFFSLQPSAYSGQEGLYLRAVAQALFVQASERGLVPSECVHAAGVVRGDYQRPALYGVPLRLVHAGVVARGALSERVSRGGVPVLYPAASLSSLEELRGTPSGFVSSTTT